MKTKELTTEEIVTNLLISNEILTPKRSSIYLSNPTRNLGDFLQSIPNEPKETKEPSKYSFIKGSWKI